MFARSLRSSFSELNNSEREGGDFSTQIADSALPGRRYRFRQSVSIPLSSTA